MTAFSIDHAIVIVRDLKTAMDDYRRLGFRVLPGGEHPAYNTHNALIVFADGSYIELLAAREAMYFTYLQAALSRDILDDELPDDSPATRRILYALGRGEGVQDFALRSDTDLPAIIASAKVGGVTLEGPVSGQRQRPDGTLLEWHFAMARTGKLPFMIHDVTPRAQRVPEDDESRTHPNGAMGIESIEVYMPDMAVQLQDYVALLGDPSEQSHSQALFTLADGAKVILRQSPATTYRLNVRVPYLRRTKIGFTAG